MRSEPGQCDGYRSKSMRRILFYNLNACLVPEERNGIQAHHTSVGFSG